MTAQERMSNISFFIGLISLVMLLFGLALPFAAFGLILALLSRGEGPMSPRARSGFVMSVIGLCAGLAITASSIYVIRSGLLNDSIENIREMVENTGSGRDNEQLLQELEEMLGVTIAPEGSDAGIGGEGK